MTALYDLWCVSFWLAAAEPPNMLPSVCRLDSFPQNLRFTIPIAKSKLPLSDLVQPVLSPMPPTGLTSMRRSASLGH